MAVLVAAVIVVGVVGLLDLVLTFGVIRRLREHNDILTERLEGTGAPIMIEVGVAADEFVATTIDGARLTRDQLTDTTLVAVMSTTCAACTERLPAFVARAAAHPGGRQQVLAVVVDGSAQDGGAADDGGAVPFLDRLPAVATVVREPVGGPLATAFGISGYPVFALVDAGGVVRASSIHPARLPHPVAV